MEAIHWALCNNPNTKPIWATALSQQAAVGINRSSYYPRLTLSSQKLGSRSENDITNKPAIDVSSNASLSLQYLIYDFGNREANVEASEHNALASIFSYHQEVQRIVMSTIRSYHALQSAYASLEAADKTLIYNKTTLDVASSKYKLGLASLVEKLQAETSVAQTQLNMESFKKEITLQQGSLLRTMGLAPTLAIKLPATTAPLFEQETSKTEIETLVQEAIKNRPDLKSAQESEKAARASLRKTETLDYPSINLTMNQDITDATRPVEVRQNDSSARISIEIPLFTGLSNKYQQIQALHNLEARSAEKEKLNQDIALEVWNAYQAYQTALTNIGLTKTLIDSANKTYQVALGRYKEGVGTILDVLNAQSQLADALLREVNAKYDVQLQRAELARAMGLLFLSPQTVPANLQ